VGNGKHEVKGKHIAAIVTQYHNSNRKKKVSEKMKMKK
jgi:hypothetical protein